MQTPKDEPKYFVEVTRNNYRNATSKEIDNALELNQRLQHLKMYEEFVKLEIQKIRDHCTHKVFYDTDGFIYMVRHCATCGSTELI